MVQICCILQLFSDVISMILVTSKTHVSSQVYINIDSFVGYTGSFAIIQLENYKTRFSSGGSMISHGGVLGPPTWALFGENVCENERIGSHRGEGMHLAHPLDPPMFWLLLL